MSEYIKLSTTKMEEVYAETLQEAKDDNQEYMLFVESSEKQAIEIHRLTKKPVLCTDTMTLHS